MILVCSTNWNDLLIRRICTNGFEKGCRQMLSFLTLECSKKRSLLRKIEVCISVLRTLHSAVVSVGVRSDGCGCTPGSVSVLLPCAALASQLELRDRQRREEDEFRLQHPDTPFPQKTTLAQRYIDEFLPPPEPE